MPDLTEYEAEILRIVKSLRQKYDTAGEAQHLKPVYLMALGMAAHKIVELQARGYSPDVVDVRLDEEVEEILIKQAHDVIAATARPYPWWRNIFTSALGGFGTLILAGGLLALLTYLEEIGLITLFW